MCSFAELRCKSARLLLHFGEVVGFDEVLDELFWRKAAKEGLLARLAPMFALLSGGNTIEGLNAYVK